MLGSISIHSLDILESGDLTICLKFSDSENILGFQVLTTQKQILEFAKNLQNFPRTIEEKIKLEWNSGDLLIDQDKIRVGRLRIMASVLNNTGYCDLSVDIIEPLKFRPGMKYKISLALEPIVINRFGSSLQKWISVPHDDFLFLF